MMKNNNLKVKFFGLAAIWLALILPVQALAVIEAYEKNELQIVITPDGFPIIWMNAEKYGEDFTYDATQVVICSASIPSAAACTERSTTLSVTDSFTAFRVYQISEYVEVTVFYDANANVIGTSKEDNTPPPPPSDEPSFNGPFDVGSLPGNFSVTSSGSASYSLGIDIPPGINGVQPAVGVAYDSQGGNGQLGMGWSITGLSQINRCSKTIAEDGFIHGVDFSIEDAFCLDGQRLVHTGGNEYRPKTGNSFKVTYVDNKFTVYAKGGSVTEYGHTADSNILAQGKTVTRVWAINKVSDNFNNSYTYTYTNDVANSAFRIASINYAANTASIDFVYEDRLDTINGYQSGSLYQTVKRLKYINVNHNASIGPVSTYKFAYHFDASPVNPSRLKAIQKCNGNKCLTPTKFNWNTREQGFNTPQLAIGSNAANGQPSYAWEGKRQALVDVTGDGLADRVWVPDGSYEVWVAKSLGESFDMPKRWLAQNAGGVNSVSWAAMRESYVDVNGDGKTDRVWMPDGRHEIWVSKSTGTSFATPERWIADMEQNRKPLSYSNWHESYQDMNGDGRTDRIWVPDGTYEVWVALSNGNDFETPQMWLNRWAVNVNVNSWQGEHILYGDVNGDGMTDRVWMPDGVHEWRVALSNGTGFEFPTVWMSKAESPVDIYSWSGQNERLVDVNADGLLDRVWRPNGRYDIWVALSTGTSFAYPKKWLAANAGGVNAYSYANQTEAYYDVNADGFADKVWMPDGLQEIWVALSDGTKFNTPERFLTSDAAGTSAIYSTYGWRNFYADINGDGSTDRLWMPHQKTHLFGSSSKAMSVRISSIEDGMNVVQNIQYKPLTDSSVYTKGSGASYPDQDIQYAQYVVSEQSTTDGLNGTARIIHHYGQARINHTGRGNLGFGWTEATNEQTGLVTRINYFQNHPFTNMVSNETQFLNGKIISYTENTPSIFPLANGREKIYLSSTLVRSYDINGSPISEVTTASQIINNPNGDVTDVQITTQNDSDLTDTHVTITHNDYEHSGSTNINLQSLVTSSSVYKTGPNGVSPTVIENFVYDLQDYTLISESGLVSEIVDNVKVDYSGITKTYTYDIFGHINTTTITAPDIETRIASTKYDSIGQFSISITNEMGHEVKTTYDPVFGVPLTETDINGLVTTYQYNNWGELTDVYSPGNNSTHTDKLWCQINCTIEAINPNVEAQVAKFSITSSVAGGLSQVKYAPDVTTYFDKLGREIRKQTMNHLGETVLVDTAYDDLGRVVAQTQPYYPGGSKHETVNVYDTLNRIKSSTIPGEGSTVVDYFDTDFRVKTTRTAWNPLTLINETQVTVEKKNIIGQVLYNTDNDGNVLHYEYDAQGNKVRTLMPSVDANGVVLDLKGTVVSINYDIFGRKESMDDPNMGYWSYTYDSTSKLRSQTDASGQTTTMEYDRLGRMVKRTDNDGRQSFWVYNDDIVAGDTHNIMAKGKLDMVYQVDVTGFEEYRQSLTYTSGLGLADTVTTVIEEGDATASNKVTYITQSSYDEFNRPEIVSYPETSANKRLQLKYVYTEGTLTEVKKADNTISYWQVEQVDAKGQITLAKYGNGAISQTKGYDVAGRLTFLDYAGGLNTLYSSEYQYDELGTLVYRKSLRASAMDYLTEKYYYDRLQRLTSVDINGISNAQEFNYDVLGNIRSKTGQGAYEYNSAKPHAVSRVNGSDYLYNNNGGITNGGGRNIVWSSFNKPVNISNSGGNSSFNYGPGRARYKQKSVEFATATLPQKELTTIYVGGSYEKEKDNGVIKHKHYIKVGGNTIAQYTVEQATPTDVGTNKLEYLLRDNQGSTVAVTNASGVVTAEMDYDAFGSRRPILGAISITSVINDIPRGYTGHEHLTKLGLIHMNGRVYDPKLARFLSADPIIQFSKNIQSYNRFSYVLNNPMSYTDPSGFSLKRLFKSAARLTVALVTGGGSEIAYSKPVRKVFMKYSWARIGLQAGASFADTFLGGGGMFSAAASAYLTDISGGSTKDVLKAAVIAGGSSYLGGKVGGTKWAVPYKMLAKGAIGAVSAKASGGDTSNAFWAGALNAAAPEGMNFVTGAIWSGTVAKITGGKFGYGAGASLFGSMLGQIAQSGKQSGGCSPNPINIATGEKYLTMLDYQNKGASKLKFERYYSSYSKATTSLGEGWRSNFDKALSFENISGQPGSSDPWTVTYTKTNREKVTFTKDKEGNWVALDNEQAILKQTQQGWQLTNTHDEIETFNPQGRLLSIQHRGGYTQQLSYNQKDQLVEVSDTFGASIQLAYNRHGLLKAMTDPEGNTTHYRYDMSKQLLSKVLYPDNTETQDDNLADNPFKQYHYNDERFTRAITGITNELGQRIHSMAYDDTGRAILSELGDHAERVDITFNNNRSSTVRNSLGRETTYHFDKNDHATSIEGHATASCVASNQAYTYDDRGNIETKTNWDGVVTSYSYNQRNLEVKRVEAQGTEVERVIETTWHPHYRLPTRIVKPGLTTEFVYNDKGLLIEQNLFDTQSERSWMQELFNSYPVRTTSYSYNAQGLLTQVDGPRTDVNDISHFAYDAKGNRIEIRNALNHISQVSSLDKRGNPLVIVDANGLETHLAYNARGWLSSKTVIVDKALGDQGKATTVYDYAHSGNYKGEGQISKVTLPNGEQVNYVYDTAYRVIGIHNSKGERISYTLDLEGNRIAETTHNAQGELVKTQQRVFDELSRLLAYIGANKQVTRYQYNKNGQLQTITDPLKNKTTQAFDALNRLIATTDANEGVVNKSYDSAGRVTSVSDQRNLTTEYRYNGFGDKIAQISPDTGTTHYAYNEAGQLISKTDARNVATHYRYDVLGRVTHIHYPADSSNDIVYTYDKAAETSGNSVANSPANNIGRLAQVTDPSGETQYRYNPQGKVQHKNYRIGDTHYQLENNYDANGVLLITTYPSGRVVSYEFNQQGRVNGLSTQASAGEASQSVVNAVSYLPFGPLSEIHYGNNTQANIQRDKDYRIESIKLTDNSLRNTLFDVNYAYDASSNITQINNQLNANQSQAFVYDDLYRLTAADGSYGRVEYDYDKVGNRLQRRLTETNSAEAMVEEYDYAHDSNRLLSVAKHDSENTSERLLSYDAVGNIINDQKSLDNNTALIYGANNRLQGIDKNATGNSGAVYLYNAKGQRVSKTVMQTDGSLEVIHFHYNSANQLIAETDASGRAIAEYLFMGNERVAKVDYSNGVEGELVFILNDHLGAPEVMTDEFRRVVWMADEMPFGQSLASLNNESQKLKFPGQYLDSESGYAYNYFRDYDASLGRYIQSDPIGLRGGVNTFGYVRGNPATLFDKLGLLDSCLAQEPYFFDDSNEVHVYNVDKGTYTQLNSGSIEAVHPEAVLIGGGALWAIPQLGSRAFLSGTFGITSTRFAHSVTGVSGTWNATGSLFKMGWSGVSRNGGGMMMRVGFGGSGNAARYHFYVPRTFVGNSFANGSIQVKRALR